jgi:two-component system response regulator AtoC
VAVNCSAIVSNLLESELFGHEKGAFTGADCRKSGKLELAGEGTVFFDEIGDMPHDLQAKLLRALQEREFERVGGSETIPLQARIISATNRDVGALVKKGGFREDLYYRIAVTRLSLPPLRERRGDVRLLAHHLLTRIGQRLHRRIEAVDEKALRNLESYDWPGNVRELENVLTRAATLSRERILSAESVGRAMGRPPAAENGAPVLTLRDAEKIHIEKALIACGWNITHTARALEISPTTLRKKIQDYGLRQTS